MLALMICRTTSIRKLKVPIFHSPNFKYFSSTTHDESKKQSFTVSYLINSCGLSSKDALSASKKVTIKSPENPDAVLQLLNQYGFTNAPNHIPKLVKRWPKILLANPDKRLLPKLEFFCSFGVPVSMLADNVSAFTLILQRSLDNYLLPTYNYLKDIVKSDQNVINVFKRAPRSFANGCESDISGNVTMLRSRGLPESSIVKLVMYQPSVILREPNRVSCFVDKAEEMGFDKSKIVFIHALQVFCNMSESTMKRKMEVYRKCGWSESDVSDLFLRFPLSMAFSEKKIVANSDFFLNEVGCEAGDIIKSPAILGMSLEKRMRPRWLVVGILKSKKLLKRTSKFTTVFGLSEKLFLKNYIMIYQNDIPRLLDFYREKLSYGELVVSAQKEGNI